MLILAEAFKNINLLDNQGNKYCKLDCLKIH